MLKISPKKGFDIKNKNEGEVEAFRVEEIEEENKENIIQNY